MSESSTPFHSNEWLMLLKEVHGMDFNILKQGETELPVVLVRSRIFGNRMISIPFADYGGPDATSGMAVKEIAEKAVAVSIDKKVDFLEIRTPIKFGDIFKSEDFIERTDYFTFVLNLRRSEVELWSSLDKRTRNDITKGQKGGFRIHEADGERQIKAFYELYAKTMKRLGSPPQPLSFITGIMKKMKDNAIIRTATINGEIAAGALFLTSSKRVHYYYSCSSYRHRKIRAGDVLLWDSIIEFRKEFSLFDFGRTRPGSGVFFYKQGWGGEKTPMPYYYKFLKKEPNERQENKYELLSNIWRRAMPNSVAKRLGPKIIRQIG